MDFPGYPLPHNKLRQALGIAALGLVAALILSVSARAELATPGQMQDVCTNWLARSVALQGPWAGSDTPTIAESGEIEKNGVVVARYFNIAPDGFIVVPTLMEMPPVKVYYPHGRLAASDDGGIVALLRDQLYAQYAAFADTYGSASAPQPSGDASMYTSKHRELWSQLAVPARDFRMVAAQAVDSAGPLLHTSWSQGSPYNLYCPTGQSGRTVVGCVATAAAQLMKYWEWPDAGFGGYSYFWNGDNSCSSTPVNAQTLSADFSDPYDWASMRDSCDDGTGCNGAQQAALAELSYEIGVALDMDYGSCGSGASQALGVYALPYHFKYDWSLSLVCRKNYDLAGWFAVIQQEIDAARPIWYGIHSHEIVADGYRTDGVTYEFHMNYGWGQGNNAWYVLDNLSCSWVSGGICPAAMENMIINIKPEESAYLSFGGCLVEPQGDGDAYVEPGESVNVTTIVRNLGWDITGPSVTVSSTDPFVTITNGTAALSASMTHGQIDTVPTPAGVAVDPSCPASHLVNLTIHLQEDGGFTVDHPLVIRVGADHGFADDAESDNGQWLHRPVKDRYNDQWHIDTFRKHGGAASWKAGGPASVEYVDGSDGGLTTVPVLLAPDSRLTFWYRMSSECGSSAGSAWDGGILMLSTDGVNWTKLYPTIGYPYTTLETGTSLNFDGTDGIFAGQLGWVQSTFDISAWTGAVQVMFRFGSDGASTGEGWYVDDVWLGNTDEGINVSVGAAENLTVVFGAVGAKGSTWADIYESGPADLPASYGAVPAASPHFFNPSTSATYLGSLTMTLGYEEAELTGNETDLVVMMYLDGSWQIVPSTLDAGNNTVSATATGLFPTVLAEKTTCCVGRVGDANMSGDDEPTIGDISVLIDAKFISGVCDGIITCLSEGDVNQSGGVDPTCDEISIGDISMLIDYLFISGPTLGLSPCL